MEIKNETGEPQIKETESQARARVRTAGWATIAGSMLEWYDFYLYATMASIVFGKVFFAAGDSQTATLKAVATFAVGFMIRPFGGLFFGYFGDRFGRKKLLTITFFLMGISTALIGFIPTYDKIGVWAPVLLIVVRMFQGLGAGAELAGAGVASYEHASPSHRGRQGAWPALGLNLGLFFSSITVYLLTLRGDEFLLAGGWRIPFIGSLVLAFIGVWVRRNLPETPQYVAIRPEKKADLSVFRYVFRHHFKGLLVVFFVAVGYNGITYIVKTFSIAYLTEYQHMHGSQTSLAVMLASLLAIIVVPLFGRLCDYWSAKVVLVTGAVLMTVLAGPFMWLLETGEDYKVYYAMALGIGLLSSLVQSTKGSFFSRQFPVEVRSTGVGVAQEVGTALSGGLAPLGALSLVAASPTHSTLGVILILVGLAIIMGLTALFDQGRHYIAHKN